MQAQKKSENVEAGRIQARRAGILFIKAPEVVGRDGRYIAYDNGIVCDCYRGREWYAGPAEDTNWMEAAAWAASLNIGGGRWQLATVAQLKDLYRGNKNKDNITPLLHMEITDVWSGEEFDEASAWGVNFIPGNSFRSYKTYRRRFRAIATRAKPYYR